MAAEQYGDIRVQLVNFIDGLLGVSAESNEATGVPEEDELVEKNILPSAGSTFGRKASVAAYLDQKEKSRAYSFGLELAAAMFDYNKRKEGDKSKASTVVADSKNKVDKGDTNLLKTKITKQQIGKAGLFLGAVAAVIMLASYVWDNFKGIGTWAMKTFAKLPSIVGALHKGLKGFFKGYAKFVSGIADWFAAGLKGAKAGAKGLAKVAGSMKAVLFKSAEFLGKRLLKIFKFLPLVGSLASFVFAYKAYSEGKWFRGTLELLSGIINLIPGPGWIISAALDGAMLLYDLTEDSLGSTGAASTAVKAVKYGMKFVPVLLKTAKTVGLRMLNVLKWIPFVGGLAGLVLSYMRFKDGEWFAGIIELISAIADFIPVYGNAVSMVLDGGLLLYDLLKTKPNEKKEAKGKQQSGGFVSVLKDTAAKVGGWLVKNIRYMPLLGNLWSIGEAIGSFMSGDWGKGTRQLLQGLFVFLPPAMSDTLVSGLDWILGLYSSSNDSAEGKSLPSTTTSFGKQIKKFIDKKVKKLPWYLRKPLEWLGILESSDVGNVSSSFSVPGWVNLIATALSGIPTMLINTIKNWSAGVANAFLDGFVFVAEAVKKAVTALGGALTKDGYMDWAHESSQLTEEDMKHTKWAGASSTQLAQDSYIKATGLSDKSELPSSLLSDQFRELVRSEEFSGNFKEYKQSVLGESASELDKINKQLNKAVREYDKLAKAGKSDSDDSASQLATVKALTYRKEHIIKSAQAESASPIVREVNDKLNTKVEPVSTVTREVNDKLNTRVEPASPTTREVNDKLNTRVEPASPTTREVNDKLNTRVEPASPTTREVNDKLNKQVEMVSPATREVNDKLNKQVQPVSPVTREVNDKLNKQVEFVSPATREVNDKLNKQVEMVSPATREVNDKLNTKVEPISSVTREVSDKLNKQVEMVSPVTREVNDKLNNRVEPVSPVTREVNDKLNNRVEPVSPVTREVNDKLNKQPGEGLDSLRSITNRVELNKDAKNKLMFESEMITSMEGSVSKIGTELSKWREPVDTMSKPAIPDRSEPKIHNQAWPDSIPPLVVPKPVDPSDILIEQNKLLVNSNQLLYEIVNANKQQLGELKKDKSATVVQAPPTGNSGFGSKGTFSSSRLGTKATYSTSPYTLGTSPSIVI